VNVDIRTPTGETTGQATLDDAIFGARVNGPLMHQIVVAQLAAARAGTHSTKTRGEVSGGGSKPWRQKGTGRARHGSVREPQWKGGGTVFGPKPRDYAPSVPKKMKAAALRSALSARAADGKVVVIDGLTFDPPKTKEAVATLRACGIEGKVLVVLVPDEVTVAFAFRNIPGVHVIVSHQLNTYDVLDAGTVLFTTKALEAFQAPATAQPVESGESS
jgi:large subunit ribosomal protein L4